MQCLENSNLHVEPEFHHYCHSLDRFWQWSRHRCQKHKDWFRIRKMTFISCPSLIICYCPAQDRLQPHCRKRAGWWSAVYFESFGKSVNCLCHDMQGPSGSSNTKKPSHLIWPRMDGFCFKPSERVRERVSTNSTLGSALHVKTHANRYILYITTHIRTNPYIKKYLCIC